MELADLGELARIDRVSVGRVLTKHDAGDVYVCCLLTGVCDAQV
jgi:hypothetical protein